MYYQPSDALHLFAAIVWAYKKVLKKKRVATDIELYSDFQMQKQIDILDQWERNIRKEEK